MKAPAVAELLFLTHVLQDVTRKLPYLVLWFQVAADEGHPKRFI